MKVMPTAFVRIMGQRRSAFALHLEQKEWSFAGEIALTVVKGMYPTAKVMHLGSGNRVVLGVDRPPGTPRTPSKPVKVSRTAAIDAVLATFANA